MMGAADRRSTSRTQASDACETSTIMPSALARRTTLSPKALKPDVLRGRRVAELLQHT